VQLLGKGPIGLVTRKDRREGYNYSYFPAVTYATLASHYYRTN
jgi:hypothetical protein